MNDGKYKEIVEAVKGIFEKEFGKFSMDDFLKVARLLGTGLRENKPAFKEFYQNLSNEERGMVDFMMYNVPQKLDSMLR